MSITTAAQSKHIVLCVVTGRKTDVTLTSAISLLRLQTRLMERPERIRADVHFVHDFNDALNVVHRSGQEGAEGGLIAEGSIGFDTDFLLRAMDRPAAQVVAGVYPLPAIDWERVATRPSGEDPPFWGNVYSVKTTGATDPATGYLQAEASGAALGLVWVRADTLADIVTRHPGIMTTDRKVGAFARDGVYDGVETTAYDRFLSLYGGRLLADPEAGATSCGPAEFGGCVGARSVLR